MLISMRCSEICFSRNYLIRNASPCNFDDCGAAAVKTSLWSADKTPIKIFQ
jgi:hypothetical protein